MRKIICSILVGVIWVLLGIGCQATPKKPTVLGKDQEQMLALATSGREMEGNLEDRLEIPKRYGAQLKDGKNKLKVNIDADIILPKGDKMPLVRVEGSSFEQGTVDKIIEILFNEGELYETESLSQMTKSDVGDRLTELKRRKIELEQQGLRPSSPSPAPKESENLKGNKGDTLEDLQTSEMNPLDIVLEGIRLMEELINSTPEDRQLVEATGKFEGNSGDIEIIHVAQMNPEGGIRSLFAANNEGQNSYWIEYINRKDFEPNFGYYYTEEIWDHQASEQDRIEAEGLDFPAMSIEEAQEIAEQFLEEIGIDYLVCQRGDRVIGGSNVEYADGTRSGNLVKAYQFQYVRQIDDVPITYTNSETAIDWGDSMVWSWDYEKMTLLVDDDGLIGVDWMAPYRLGETVTDNTAILPFPKIQDIFEKMIIIDNALDEDDLGADMHITEIRLGLARIWEENNLSRGLLIPVWDFFGTKTIYYRDENGQKQSFVQRDIGQSWLTINAIDGTIIDRSAGY